MKPDSKCPTCGRPLGAGQEHQWRPFCSERCRLIDLGDWMAGRYHIPGDEPAPADDAESPFTKH